MAISIIRTAILYFFITAALRISGKRQLGELQPSELVVTLIVSEFAAIPMQDNNVPLLRGILPILMLMSLEIIMSLLNYRFPKLRALITGKPSVIIRLGQVDIAELERSRFTMDDLNEQLRQNGFRGAGEIAYGVIETSGSVSLLPWKDASEATPPTAAQNDPGLPLVVIAQGSALVKNLTGHGLSVEWLLKRLNENGYKSPEQIYYMSVDLKHNVFIVPWIKSPIPRGRKE